MSDVNLLDVTRTGERAWTVHPFEGDPVEDAIRTHDNQAAAWHHAVWMPLHEANVLPEMHTPQRNIFIDSRVSRGYTADPRFAEHLPAQAYDTGATERCSQLVTDFIQSRINDPLYMTIHGEEVSMTTEAETQEAPQEAQNTPSESPAGDHGVTAAPDPREAVRTALSDSERNAFDNYTHMAENAGSEQAREFWQGKADEVASSAA